MPFCVLDVFLARPIFSLPWSPGVADPDQSSGATLSVAAPVAESGVYVWMSESTFTAALALSPGVAMPPTPRSVMIATSGGAPNRTGTYPNPTPQVMKSVAPRTR